MARGWATFLIVPLLASCSQSDTPADDLEQVADAIVEEVGGEPATPPPAAAAGPYAPRDECAELDGAADFHRQLIAAVENRDADGFAALAAQDVKLDAGAGREELHRRLTAEDGGLWRHLDALVTLGCDGDRQKGITLPWYFARDIPGDPARTMIVTGEGVPLLAEPADHAEKLGVLSWDAVQSVGEEQPVSPAVYRHVALPDGTEGYVRAEKLRALRDYRLFAISRNGNWRITRLVSGD